MSAMDQEIITPPAAAPRGESHAFSPFGCFLAAAGATLMTFTLTGAAAAAAVWALAKLLDLPDIMLYTAMAVAFVPVLWATVWTAGRAWHVEQLLSQDRDVDTPVFKLVHYLKAGR